MSARGMVGHAVAAIALAVLLCALVTTPAWADDGVPPPEPTAESTAEPVESAAADEPAVDAAPAAGEAAPPQELTTAELLAAAPEGTIAIVVSDEGQALPLATLEAAEVIAAADPIWCPASVSVPVAGASGCTPSFTSLQALIDYLTLNQPAVDGVIWIEKGYDSSVDDPGVTLFTMDGGTLTTMSAYRLTIRGGWNGPGTRTVDPNDPSEINAHLHILNWQNDVTLTDLLVTGATTGGDTLQVTTTGRIVLTRVAAEANAGGGARLDNRAGTADVVVTLGRFSGNAGGSGLQVLSRGAITLAGVVASGNGGSGAYLDNSTAPAARSVVMTTGVFEFNNNANRGLWIYSLGSIALRDITAVANGHTGVQLSNSLGTGAGISLAGLSILCENGNAGLSALSRGPITASNLVANANGTYGAILENHTAATPQAVSLTGASQFKYNGSGGLRVVSLGNITLANATASASGSGEGALLSNDFDGATGSVTLTGASVFNDNWGSGLWVGSRGAIALSNVTALRNGLAGAYGYGAYLANSGALAARPVTLSGANAFNQNYSAGLFINSRGAVSLSRVTADGNLAGYGSSISNTASGTASPQNVTLSGSASFSGNGGAGLSVYSFGAIAIANLRASDNDAYGASLANHTGTLPRALTLSGTNDCSGNGGDGLAVHSLGAITVNNLTASDNVGSGAYLQNFAGLAAVNVSGTGMFSGNGGSGLVVYSRGAITVKDFDADWNGEYGVYLYNAYSGAVGGVTVGTSRANWVNSLLGNYYSGMEVWSNGAVTLSNIGADYNGDASDPSPYGWGVLVSNSSAPGPRAVTIKGIYNRFDSNYSGGLYVASRGPISGSSLSASGNVHGGGVYLYNAQDPAAPQNVTLTGSQWIADNDYTGLEIWTYGTIAVSNLSASGNGHGSGTRFGAYLNNRSGATLPRNVTLTGWNSFADNAADGLRIQSLGAIGLSNLSAHDNGGNGAHLSNAYAGASGGITLSGSGYFSGNAAAGLTAISYGNLAASNLSAYGNGTVGASLNNDGAPAARAVTLSGQSWFGWNGQSGLTVWSRGPVTVSNVTAQGNAAFGVQIHNLASGSAAPQNVTLSGASRFEDNGWYGLSIATYGAITASNLTASWNGWDGSYAGALLNNASGSVSPRGVTLSGTNRFEGNTQDGLTVISLGPIRINNLQALDNGLEGAYLDNQLPGAAGGVTLTGASVLEGNRSGMMIFSHGALSLSNVTARWNLEDGVYLETVGILAPQKVTLSGVNVFSGNGDHVTHVGFGLIVVADGPITVSNLTASGNAAYGAALDNRAMAWSGTPGITLTGVNTFSDNYNDGLWFNSYGPVTISNLTADGNGQDGIDGRTDGNVTITTGSLTANGGYGWKLETPAVVTLKGVHAYGNGTNGILTGGGTLKIYRS